MGILLVKIRVRGRASSGSSQAQKYKHDCVFERPTCFICCGMCRHTPGARLAPFGYHDSKLIHGVWFEASDGVAECSGVCRLEHTKHL